MRTLLILLLSSVAALAQPVFPPAFWAPVTTAGGGVADYTNGLIAWFKGSTITGLVNGNNVTNWFDGSGNSRNLVQLIPADMPYYTNVASANNAAGAVFNGSSSTMDWTNVNVAATNYYIIASIDCKDGANSTEERLMGESAGRLILDTNDGANKVGWYDGAFHVFNSSTAGLKVYEWVLDTTGDVRTNNVSLGTAAYTKVALNSANSLTIGSSSGATFWKGTIYEFRIYGFIPASGDRTTVYNAVKAYVGL